MSPTYLLRDSQITAALNNILTNSSFINSSATFTKSNAHKFAMIGVEKGVEFNETISISNEIIEQHDTFTFKFNIPGVYRIDYRLTMFIHENNAVQDLHIRPSVSDTLTDTDEFLNYSDFGIITTRKLVQTSSNVDKVSDHAVDSIYDSCVYRYDGNGDIYFKLLAWGPTTQQSYIESGATLIFTYLSS